MSKLKYCKNLLDLPAGTIKTIWDLRLNRRKIRTKICERKAQKEANIRNLRQVLTVNLGGSYKTDNWIFATLNARSLKSKEHFISESIEEYILDALIITETWLQKNKEDDQWIKSSKLNTNGYHIQTINRINKRGRGSVLTTKDKAKFTNPNTNNYTTFEHK